MNVQLATQFRSVVGESASRSADPRDLYPADLRNDIDWYAPHARGAAPAAP